MNICKKTSFLSEKFADLHIKKLRETGKYNPKIFRAYLCEKCHCWHLTTTTKEEEVTIDYLLLKTKSKNKKIMELLKIIKVLKNEIKTLKSK